MPKLDLSSLPVRTGSNYLPPFDGPVLARSWRAVAAAGGLCQFGANLVTLESGAWSSQRHWHDEEDELLIMLSGEAVLVEDGGRTVLRPGDVCAWPKGVANGHHLINESASDCSFIAISAGNKDGTGAYSDIDMKFDAEGFYHKDGTPYPTKRMT